MQESDSVPFTEVLRLKVQTGNDAQVKQAALQAIEQLERLSTQLPQVSSANPDSVHSANDWSSTPVLNEDYSTEGTQMVTVTSHQLRMLRKDLRETTRQRDEALIALQNQKEKDNRRFNDIQELQTDLNSAFEQYEQLLPKFKEVLASRRELETKVQTLTKDLQRQKQNHQEMEEAVVSLLSTCEGLLKDLNHESRGLQMPTVLDSILTIKAEMEEFTSKKSMKHCNGLSPWEGVFRKSGMAEGEVMNRRSSDGLIPRPRTATPTPPSSDLNLVVDNLKLMVDQERDLRRYFEAQTLKLQRMKTGNDSRRNSWTRTSSEWSPRKEDSPSSELQERLMIIAKIQDKDQEISELFNELEQSRTGDENLVDTLLSLEDSHPTKCSQKGHSLQQSSGDYSERLNRLQECAGMLEKQLLAVKTENKDLRIEKQHLVNRIQSSSSAK